MKQVTLKTPQDIPVHWVHLKARKKTSVQIRGIIGEEEFSVAWQDAVLIGKEDEDLAVISADGAEYPCKKEIFFSTYDVLPALVTEDYIAGYRFVKKSITTLVVIPPDTEVTIETLEGVLPVVTAPDYIVIGAKGELYANTAAFVAENLEIVK